MQKTLKEGKKNKETSNRWRWLLKARKKRTTSSEYPNTKIGRNSYVAKEKVGSFKSMNSLAS